MLVVVEESVVLEMASLLLELEASTVVVELEIPRMLVTLNVVTLMNVANKVVSLSKLLTLLLLAKLDTSAEFLVMTVRPIVLETPSLVGELDLSTMLTELETPCTVAILEVPALVNVLYEDISVAELLASPLLVVIDSTAALLGILDSMTLPAELRASELLDQIEVLAEPESLLVESNLDIEGVVGSELIGEVVIIDVALLKLDKLFVVRLLEGSEPADVLLSGVPDVTVEANTVAEVEVKPRERRLSIEMVVLAEFEAPTPPITNEELLPIL